MNYLVPFLAGSSLSCYLFVKTTTFIFAVFGLTALPVSAQPALNETEGKLVLETERLQFQKAIIESSLTPMKKHLLELTALEKNFASTRNYNAAIHVRDQRRSVEGELERLDKELLLLKTREQSLKAELLPERITLPLEKASLSGVQFINGSLLGWNRPGSSAKWKLPDLPSGGYEVILRYRCGPLDGGVVQVQETKFALKNQIDTTLNGPQEKNLGTLKISDGSGSLTLAAVTLVKDRLMDLLDIYLVPASR